MTAPADGLPVWLIERGQPEGQEPTIWWRGKEQSGVPYMGLWTETAHDAMAFSSKATAEAFIASNYIRLRRATEHVFLNRADRLYARNFDLNREIVELRAKAQALQEQVAQLADYVCPRGDHQKRYTYQKDGMEHCVVCERDELDKKCGAAESALTAALEREKALRHWLDNNTTFYDVDAAWPIGGHNIPVLAQVSQRIWYHATDNITDWPFRAVIAAALSSKGET